MASESDSPTELVEVALFPIPDVVAFPGTTLPLHVFEPRYRRLVQDCLRDERMLGVSHTGKTIRQAPPAENLEQALRSNQATYAPREVFSAGRCELIETLDDGRMIIEVAMTDRLTLVEEIQSLPYRIVTCTPREDEAITDASAARALQEEVHGRLTELVRARSSEGAGALEDPLWASLDPAEYSFRIFEVVRFDADLMQEILEMTDPAARLERLRRLLGQARR